MKKIILASASPRRQQLLANLGVPFTSFPANIDEGVFLLEKPRDAVRRIAEAKARAVAVSFEEGLIIAADTAVVLAGEFLGKPSHSREAMVMLQRLSGRPHQVITAVCLYDVKTGQILVDEEETRVYFRNLTREEIESYVNTGEPMDKAGAYGIQDRGALLVEKIEGCYFNVVGLPLGRLYLMLKSFDVNLLEVRD